MEEQTSVITSSVEHRSGSTISYAAGFFLSVIFTVIAFGLAGNHLMHGKALMAGLIGLAIVQFWVQMLFFLHIGKETKPHWKRLLLFLMIVVVLILVLGSLWVMYNLSNRMMPDQINQYMLKQTESGL